MPASLIASEKEHRKKQLEQDPKYRAQFQSFTEEQRQEADQVLYQKAEEAVRLFYISRSIIRNADIKVSESEVKAEAMKTLGSFGPVNIDPNKIPNEVFALALSKVILAKAQNFIMEKAGKNS